MAVLVLCPLFTAMTGEPNIYALTLLPLNVLFWAATRIFRLNLGVRSGNLRGYLFSLLYPIAVMGMTSLIILFAGAMQVDNIVVTTLGRRIFVLVLTEEGFFRGWLWSILEKTSQKLWIRLIWTSGVFCLWHYAVTTMVFHLPKVNVPIYLGNILLIGLVFGLLRQMSGSVLVPSVSHALWNALSYTLYGMGEKPGALTITSRNLFDPEIGFMGLLLNLIAVVLLWRMVVKRGGTQRDN
ncbi:MAG: lysostaphin resistance A-like protein [bacterium]